MFKKIYIEITNICNLKCKFCPETKRNKEFMSIENFEKIIKKVHSYTNLICLHVKGEPLLHPELHEILNILNKYGLQANITTNGTLIKEKIDILKRSKSLRQINFSIHSITQNKNIDNEYLNNIFCNVEQLPNTIISYRLWNISRIHENEANKKIIKQIEEYYKISNLLEKLKQSNFFKIRENVFINQDMEFIWPSLDGNKIVEEGRCLALKHQIAILADGTVVPCCLDNDGNMALGNILEEKLDNILVKTKSQTIKNNFENRIITCNLCKTCGFLKNLEEKRKPIELI